MNLTKEYRTVRALFEKPDSLPGIDEGPTSSTGHQVFATSFTVFPINYFLEIDKIDDLCHFKFGYKSMVGTSQELTEYFSWLWKKKITDIELGRLQDQFERDPTGVLKVGNASKVFGKVMAILHKFKAEYGFTCLKFGSHGKSRTDLYRQLIERFLPDWKKKEELASGQVIFTACEPGAQWPFA